MGVRGEQGCLLLDVELSLSCRITTSVTLSTPLSITSSETVGKHMRVTHWLGTWTVNTANTRVTKTTTHTRWQCARSRVRASHGQFR